MDPLTEAAELIGAAASITALTGAGVSAASGIPTFRGAAGLWRTFRAEDLATPGAFRRDPRLVWEWYDWRRQTIAAAQPNAAHTVLAGWTRRSARVTVITQNVDGLHERAGTDRLVRLHGSIWILRCWDACGAGEAGWTDETTPLRDAPPRCPHCGGLARPGVVWFGEPLPDEAVQRATAATRCDLFLSIGTSALVYPAAGLAGMAKGNGATVIEINPDETSVAADVDLAIRMPAEDALPRLDAALAMRREAAGRRAP